MNSNAKILYANGMLCLENFSQLQLKETPSFLGNWKTMYGGN